MTEEPNTLELPATIDETNDLIASITGDIAGIKVQIETHFQRHGAGQNVDWDWFSRAKSAKGHMVGDLAALKRHCKHLIAAEKLQRQGDAAGASVQKTALKAAAAQLQIEREGQVMRLRQERMDSRHKRSSEREYACRKALLEYCIRQWPEQEGVLRGVLVDAQKAFDVDNPVAK